MSEVSYILGHSEPEMRRLMLEAAILRPITERLLREAGLVAGMRVLDLGCGIGDVAMLAAALVGPSGAVVGIDRSAEVLTIARERAGAAGYANIEFHEGAAESFIDPAPFDLVIGRYVLIHQLDPAAFIRAAASQVRPGGIIAFHEIALYGECEALPSVPLWSQTRRWIVAAFESRLAHPDAAGRMIAHFRDAGLKQPTMFCEIPIAGGPDSPLYAWAALTVRSLIPPLEQCGAAAAVELGIDTLADRLRKAVCAAQAQALALRQFCGWLKL